ncbi:transposase [Paraburkholderia ribeironis]|uniref:Transposase n=1 Tax=Paraburkholderia ribeironis TaxID=1247936 RepID=A0A1N7RXP5_9BURK|nr:transposase [Paraburkholderia ribeironis]SIT39888.1 transposase [Paraburkholderia ribeironis]
MNPHRDITDEEWQRVALLLPELRPRSELRGRPLANTRSVLNGVLWVMYSGATWSAMPRRYPSYQTCHRRFKVWYESGVLKRVMEQLFGTQSEELCSLMEARMRTHVSAEQKSIKGAKVPATVPATPARYSPALSKPLPPSPFPFTSPFKHAA